MIEDYFNKDICILVQGPITFYESIIKSYHNYKENVLISTNDTNKIVIEELQAAGLNILINKIALFSGRANFNNQVLNTFNGLVKAKEMGFKYVLKIRGDIFIDRISDLINTFDLNTIYFPAYHNHDGGYLCEHMIFGEIDFMLSLWNIPLSVSDIAPEIQLTEHFDKISHNYKIDFIFPILYNKQILAYWAKYKLYLNEYEKDRLFIYTRK